MFQLQVYYVAPDGTKAVRVYTKEQELSSDRDQDELNMMDRDVLFANMAQKASYFALESNVKCAKYKAKTSNRMAERRQMQMPQQLCLKMLALGICLVRQEQPKWMITFRMLCIPIKRLLEAK